MENCLRLEILLPRETSGWCISGEEFVSWKRENTPEKKLFGGKEERYGEKGGFA